MTLHPNYRFENFAIYYELCFSWPSLLQTYLQSSGFVLSSCMLQQKRIRFCWLSCLRFKLGGMKFGTLNSLWMVSGKNLLWTKMTASVGCYNFKAKSFLFNHAKLPCLISHWRNELQKDSWGKATLSAVITWMSDHCKYAVFYEFKIFKCFFSGIKD